MPDELEKPNETEVPDEKEKPGGVEGEGAPEKPNAPGSDAKSGRPDASEGAGAVAKLGTFEGAGESSKSSETEGTGESSKSSETVGTGESSKSSETEGTGESFASGETDGVGELGEPNALAAAVETEKQTQTEDPVSVDNQLTFSDYLNVYCQPVGPVPRLFFVGAFGALVGFIVAQGSTSPGLAHFTITFTALELICLDLFIAWRIHKAGRKNTTATFVLGKDALMVTTSEGSKSKVDWKNVVSIEQKAGAIAIQVSKSPKIYFWIPRRRFASSDKADFFLEKANEYWTNWLMIASVEGAGTMAPSTEYDDPRLPFVDVDLTLRELVICDALLQKRVYMVGLLFLVWGVIDMTLSFWAGTLILIFGIFLLAAPTIGSYRKYRKHPNVLSGRTTITEDGLRPYNSATGYDTTLSWEAMQKIYVWREIAFFEMRNKRAIVVPLRCFKTKEAADQFMAMARAKWNDRNEKKLTDSG